MSILNDVLGPVMRGPSSSHTAGAYRIGCLARDLLGEEPRVLHVGLDPRGSYAPTYQICGVEQALICGVLAIPLVSERFFEATQIAQQRSLDVRFEVRDLPEADHPNYMSVVIEGTAGNSLSLAARSIGGGLVEILRVTGMAVLIDGKSPVALELPGTKPSIRRARPVFYPQGGQSDPGSAVDLRARAESTPCSLGEAARARESELLGLSIEELDREMPTRLDVMLRSVEEGLAGRELAMPLLEPSAGSVLAAEAAGRVAIGGPHARAASRALAVTHVNNSFGVVCAAPTGGSAGTIPAVLSTWAEEKKASRGDLLLGLWAAGAVGLVLASRGTFAAETAGCQVEIGTAGAMAAAAVVEMAGGAPSLALDAAAIAFQNTMGLVCDPVQGGCEIPCHTRNAVAASSAFVCADLVLGGYRNPIPLDETVDAVMEVGARMAPELRCTALGGIAATPSARAMRPRDRRNLGTRT